MPSGDAGSAIGLNYCTNQNWSHAGGVVFRGHPAGMEILLVRARPEPHDWVIPKGHIDAGETPHECARREIREEAGVDSAPIAFLGDVAFTTAAGEGVSAAFFLMRYLNDVPPDEKRERRWCTFSEALASIEFDATRALIREAEARLTAGEWGGLT